MNTTHQQIKRPTSWFEQPECQRRLTTKGKHPQLQSRSAVVRHIDPFQAVFDVCLESWARRSAASNGFGAPEAVDPDTY